MNRMPRLFPLVILLLVALAAIPQNPRMQPGPHPEGGYLLMNGWRIAPAGISIPFPRDTFPLNLVMHPDGKSLFVLNSGYLPPSVLIMNTADPRQAVRVSLDDAWLGLALNKAGDKFYVPEANLGTVREFAFADGVAKPLREFRLFPLADPTKKGKERLSKEDYLGDAALSADGKTLYVANLQSNVIHAIGLEKGDVSRKFTVGKRPYRILVAGDRLYVSNWGDESVTVLDAASGAPRLTIKTGSHPTDMVLRDGRLYVACGNTNSVYMHDATNGTLREQINVALHPKSPAGTTPNALAISPDGHTLYVANADNNDVAVVSIVERESRVEGFIPTGWYPTAVLPSPDGRRLYIANGKGERSYANPNGPQPIRQTQVAQGENPRPGYVGVMQKGSLNIVDVPDDAQLKILTRRVLNNTPYRDELLENAAVSGTGIPSRLGGESPIKHVIYIVKENRTYDQVLGDMKEGNGDARLTLFPENISPNHHRLAREFGLLDNFYVTADVSADGHAWSMGAISSDFVTKLWPAGYAGRRAPYDSEGVDQNGTAGGGWLWNAALKARVSFRVYGEFVQNDKDKEKPSTNREKEVAGFYDPNFRGFDLDYTDQKRMDRWLTEFREFEKNGKLPQLEIMRLPNDHTQGTKAGAPSPRAMVADNDFALGRLVDAVSHSVYWKDTAIFVLEDDAQNGPDHVDSHRSPAYVISAYSQRGKVDSTMYSTVSMLRTIGLILGMQPMSQYDAGAMPMHTLFAGKPDLRPYTLVKPEVDLNETNTPQAPMAKEAAAMDFSDADRIDDDLMNLILWKAMKGNTPMPAATRSVFPAMWIFRAR